MPRYKLIIEYDGSPSAAGRSRTMALRAGRAGGPRSRRSAANRSACTARAAPMPACMRSARSRIATFAKHFVPGRFRDGLNAHLRPHPIGVLSAEIVPETFEARFSAKKRHYLYGSAIAAPISRSDIGRAWRLPRRLDTDAMHEAAQNCRQARLHHLPRYRMPGEIAGKDSRPARRFARRRQCQHRHSARSFLHSQVRSMVGSLVWVGDGRWRPDDLAAALAARDRAAAARSHRGRALSGAGGVLIQFKFVMAGLSRHPRPSSSGYACGYVYSGERTNGILYVG